MKTKNDPSNLTLEYLRNTSNRPLPGSHLAPNPRTPTRYILNPTKYILSLTTTDRVLDSSHLGSAGSSSSETLARTGPSPEDSRAIRTRGVLEFIEELESKDTCLGHQDRLVPHNVGWALKRGGVVEPPGWQSQVCEARYGAKKRAGCSDFYTVVTEDD